MMTTPTDSLSPLTTTNNNNHCNHLLDQQTTPLPFSTTYPIVHHPSSDATLNMNNSIWDFLMAQIRSQLRGMSPDACFIHVRELQEMAHSELLLSSSDYHLNGMSSLPIDGRQHRTSATAGYRNNQQHNSVSSISSSMRQQQLSVGSSTAGLALFSPMGRGRDLTTVPPQSPVASPSHSDTESETELDDDEVSSSPSKMILMTATNDDGQDMASRISEEPLMSSSGLKFHEDSPPAQIRPNQKKKDVPPTTTPLPPSKKISSTMKAATTKVATVKAKKSWSATKSSPVKGGSSKAKKGFTLGILIPEQDDIDDCYQR